MAATYPLAWNSQLSNPPLLPVDRSKLFVMNRLANSKLVDAARIARAIEFTRFPPQELDHKDKEETVGEMRSRAGKHHS
jgi:hypothetical protein